MIFKAVIITYGLVFLTLIIVGLSTSKEHKSAFAECNTLGGTLIISADDRYICVPDAVEVGK